MKRFSLESKNHNWKNVLLFFIPFFYLYIRVINSYIALASNGSVEGRANYIIILTFIGFILLKGHKINKAITSASIFTLYMIIFPLVEGVDNIITYMASYIIWPVMFYITYNMNYREKDINLIGYLGALTCNITAYIYITMTNMDIYSMLDENNAVAGFNSIYNILLLFPFIFLIQNKLHVLMLTLLPLSSFVISTKSTCILSAIMVLCYYLYTTFKNLKMSKKVVFIIIGIALLFLFFQFFNFSDTILSLQEDVDSGGNGRTDIASRVLDKFFNESSFFEILVGHGSDAIAKALKIGAHNDFLETLYNYGLVGIGIFFYFWYNLIKNIKLLRCNSEVKRAYIISLIVFFCCCMASKLLGTQIQMILLAIFWGITLKKNDIKYENSINRSI